MYTDPRNTLFAEDGAAVSIPCDTPVGYVTKATAAAVQEFERLSAVDRRECRRLKLIKKAEAAFKELCLKIKLER
jgi:hypothetical protein